jgi:hypothetical protein
MTITCALCERPIEFEEQQVRFEGYLVHEECADEQEEQEYITNLNDES